MKNNVKKVRGFEPVISEMMKGIPMAYKPIRADNKSAGYDFSTPVQVVIPAKGKKLIWTNIKAYMLEDEVLKLFVRSSIGIKKGLILANIVGIIDAR